MGKVASFFQKPILDLEEVFFQEQKAINKFYKSRSVLNKLFFMKAIVRKFTETQYFIDLKSENGNVLGTLDFNPETFIKINYFDELSGRWEKGSLVLRKGVIWCVLGDFSKVEERGWFGAFPVNREDLEDPTKYQFFFYKGG